MKKILASLLMALSLSSCALFKTEELIKPSVVIEYKTIVIGVIPSEHLMIPEKVSPINVDKSTQKDVADWLARSEGRTNDLETKLIKIKDIQDKQKAEIK